MYYFPKKSIPTARNYRLFGPWAVRAVVYGDRVDVLVPALGAAISGHVGV